MEYRHKWMFSALLIIVIGVGGLFAVLQTRKASPRITHDAFTETVAVDAEDAFIEVPVVISIKNEVSDQGMHFTMNTEYPEIALAQHPTLAKEANDVITSFVESIKNDFKKNLAEISKEDVRDNLTSDLTMRFTPLLLSPTIISIRFDSSEYIAGALHPNNQVRILNYNIAKHLLLSPTDLFASSTQAVPFLSDYSRKALRILFADMSEIDFVAQTFPGTAPTAQNFQEVGITKTGLSVFFSQYQVAPYARGIPEVRIPLHDMSNVSSTDSLLSMDVSEAVRMASDNIVEATPME